MAETPAAVRKIINLEDIHCVRDAGTVHFRRPRRANVDIGGCDSPATKLTCRSRRIVRPGRLSLSRLQIRLTGASVVDAFEAGRPRTKSGRRREEHQCSYLDALPRLSAPREPILERGVRRQPGAPVVGAVMYRDQQRFVERVGGDAAPCRLPAMLTSRFCEARSLPASNFESIQIPSLSRMSSIRTARF